MVDATSRAFIIGDFEKGITIVITNPVMVAHYSIDALKNDPGNALKGADTNDLIAGLVRERVFGEDDGPAPTQRHEHFEHRQIEANRGRRQHPGEFLTAERVVFQEDTIDLNPRFLVEKIEVESHVQLSSLSIQTRRRRRR